MFKKLIKYVFHKQQVKSTRQDNNMYDENLKILREKISKYDADIERINAEQKETKDEIAELLKINGMVKDGKLDEYEEALLKDMKLIEDIENMQKLNSNNHD